MRRIVIGALATALLVPAALAAQPGRRQAGPPAGRDMNRPNIARALVDNSEALGLDDQQVERLRSLADRAERQRMQLRALREEMAGQTELTDEQRTRLREGARTAMEAEREIRDGIRSTLTVEQFDRAAQLGRALGSLGGGQARQSGRFGQDRFGGRRGDAWAGRGAPRFRGAPGQGFRGAPRQGFRGPPDGAARPGRPGMPGQGLRRGPVPPDTTARPPQARGS